MISFKVFTDTDSYIDFGTKSMSANIKCLELREKGQYPVLVSQCGSEFTAYTTLAGERVVQSFKTERQLLEWIGMHSFT